MALEDRFADGSAVLSVVGLGYVGLPLVVEMAKAGHRVIGVDVSAEKVELVNKGESYIPDVPTDELAELVAKGLVIGDDRLRGGRASADAVVICVPTPARRVQAARHLATWRRPPRASPRTCTPTCS